MKQLKGILFACYWPRAPVLLPAVKKLEYVAGRLSQLILVVQNNSVESNKRFEQGAHFPPFARRPLSVRTCPSEDRYDLAVLEIDRLQIITSTHLKQPRPSRKQES